MLNLPKIFFYGTCIEIQLLHFQFLSKIRFNMLQVVADCLIKNPFKPKKAC